METYIIITENIADATALAKYIKEQGTWAKLTNNAWSVKTSMTAVQLRDQIKLHGGRGGKLYVIRSGALAAWTNASENVTAWLKENL